MAYATKWTGRRGTQKDRVWRKTRKEEFDGIGTPEMSSYWNRCTHTQELDTPEPTTGCFSYKAPTPPPPLCTQGSWKQDKSLHRFPSISTLCYGSEFCLIPHRYVNCSRNIYRATRHSQPRGLLIRPKPHKPEPLSYTSSYLGFQLQPSPVGQTTPKGRQLSMMASLHPGEVHGTSVSL